MQPIDVNCNMGWSSRSDCPDFHPMKGPMTTQTMQDLIGKETVALAVIGCPSKLTVHSMSFLAGTSFESHRHG